MDISDPETPDFTCKNLLANSHRRHLDLDELFLAALDPV